MGVICLLTWWGNFVTGEWQVVSSITRKTNSPKGKIPGGIVFFATHQQNFNFWGVFWTSQPANENPNFQKYLKAFRHFQPTNKNFNFWKDLNVFRISESFRIFENVNFWEVAKDFWISDNVNICNPNFRNFLNFRKEQLLKSSKSFWIFENAKFWKVSKVFEFSETSTFEKLKSFFWVFEKRQLLKTHFRKFKLPKAWL